MSGISTTARPSKRPQAPALVEPERMPPHEPSAEAGVLGSMLIDPPTIPVVNRLVREEDFFGEANRVIFRAINAVYAKHHTIDGTLILAQLNAMQQLDQIGGVDYLKDIANTVPTSANAEYYAAIVAEKARLRGCIKVGAQLLRAAYEPGAVAQDVVGEATGKLALVSRGSFHATKTMAESMHEGLETLEMRGLSTGIHALDEILGGVHGGQMLVIGARPSMGKTALAVNTIAWHHAKAYKKRVLVFSLEMKAGQLAVRLACSLARVQMREAQLGRLNAKERDRLALAVGQVAGVDIRCHDQPAIPLPELLSVTHHHAATHGVDEVIIDYVQLVEPPAETRRTFNRTQQVGVISRTVKGLAGQLNIPVIVLSQLNRESERGDRMPRMSDLRESGDLEQDADTVLLLHREEVVKRGDEEWRSANPDKLDEAQIVVGKNRNGPTGLVTLTFDAPSMTFMDRRF